MSTSSTRNSVPSSSDGALDIGIGVHVVRRPSITSSASSTLGLPQAGDAKTGKTRRSSTGLGIASRSKSAADVGSSSLAQDVENSSIFSGNDLKDTMEAGKESFSHPPIAPEYGAEERESSSEVQEGFVTGGQNCSPEAKTGDYHLSPQLQAGATTPYFMAGNKIINNRRAPTTTADSVSGGLDEFQQLLMSKRDGYLAIPSPAISRSSSSPKFKGGGSELKSLDSSSNRQYFLSSPPSGSSPDYSLFSSNRGGSSFLSSAFQQVSKSANYDIENDPHHGNNEDTNEVDDHERSILENNPQFDQIYIKTALKERQRLAQENQVFHKDIAKLNRKLEQANERFDDEVIMQQAVRKWKLTFLVFDFLDRQKTRQLSIGFNQLRSQVAKVTFFRMRRACWKAVLNLMTKNIRFNHLSAVRVAFNKIKARSASLLSKLLMHKARRDRGRMLISWRALREIHNNMAQVILHRQETIRKLFKIKSKYVVKALFCSLRSNCEAKNRWITSTKHFESKLTSLKLLQKCSKLQLHSAFKSLKIFNSAICTRQLACKIIVNVKRKYVEQGQKEMWNHWKNMCLQYNCRDKITRIKDTSMCRIYIKKWRHLILVTRVDQANAMKLYFSNWKLYTSANSSWRLTNKLSIFCTILSLFEKKARRVAITRSFDRWRMDSVAKSKARLQNCVEKLKSAKLLKMVAVYNHRTTSATSILRRGFWRWYVTTERIKTLCMIDENWTRKLQHVFSILIKQQTVIRHRAFIRMRDRLLGRRRLLSALTCMNRNILYRMCRLALKKWKTFLASQVDVWEYKNRRRENNSKSLCIIFRKLKRYCLMSYFFTWRRHSVKNHSDCRKIIRLVTISRLNVIRTKFQQWREMVRSQMNYKFHDFYFKKMTGHSLKFNTFQKLKTNVTVARAKATSFARTVFIRFYIKVLRVAFKKWIDSVRIENVVFACALIARRLRHMFKHAKILRAFTTWRAVSERKINKLLKDSTSTLRESLSLLKRYRIVTQSSKYFSRWLKYSRSVQRRKLACNIIFRLFDKKRVCNIRDSFFFWKKATFHLWVALYAHPKLRLVKLRGILSVLQNKIYMMRVVKYFHRWRISDIRKKSIGRKFFSSLRRRNLASAFRFWLRMVQNHKKASKLFAVFRFYAHRIAHSAFIHWKSLSLECGVVVDNLAWKNSASKHLLQFRLMIFTRFLHMKKKNKLFYILKKFRRDSMSSKRFVLTTLRKKIVFLLSRSFRLWREMARFQVCFNREIQTSVSGFCVSMASPSMPSAAASIRKVVGDVDAFPSAVLSIIDDLEDLLGELYTISVTVFEASSEAGLMNLLVNEKKYHFNNKVYFARVNMDTFDLGRSQFANTDIFIDTGFAAYSSSSSSGVSDKDSSSSSSSHGNCPSLIEIPFLINHGKCKLLVKLSRRELEHFTKSKPFAKSFSNSTSSNIHSTTTTQTPSFYSSSTSPTILVDMSRVTMVLMCFHEMHLQHLSGLSSIGGGDGSARAGNMGGRDRITGRAVNGRLWRWLLDDLCNRGAKFGGTGSSTGIDVDARSAGNAGLCATSVSYSIVNLLSILLELFSLVSSRATLMDNSTIYSKLLANKHKGESSSPFSGFNLETFSSRELPLASMTKTEVIDVLHMLEDELKNTRSDLKMNKRRIFFVEYYKKKLQQNLLDCKEALRRNQEALSETTVHRDELEKKMSQLTGKSKVSDELLSTIMKSFEVLHEN